MRENLFRDEAIDARETRFTTGRVLLVYPAATWIFSAFVGITAILVIAFVTLGMYAKRATVTGQLVPTLGLVRVFAPIPTVVLERLVTEGQRVDKNQVLFVTTSDTRSAALGDTQNAVIEQISIREKSLSTEKERAIASYREELAALNQKKSTLRTQLTAIDAQLCRQRERVSLAENAATRYRRLLDGDYASLDQSHQKEADRLEQLSRLNDLERGRAATLQDLQATEREVGESPRKAQNRLAQLERLTSETIQELAQDEAKRRLVIASPVRGIAAAVLAENGQFVDPTRSVVSIIPEGSQLEAVVYAPSEKVGFVHEGDRASVRFHAYPYQKFGQYGGAVKSISLSPMMASELATIAGGVPGAESARQSELLYRIVVKLDSQFARVAAKDVALRSGMSVDVDLLQEPRRIVEWIFEPFYSYREPG